MGLTDDEFWHLTPVELDLLWQAHTAKRRREVLPLALLIQDFRNVHRDPQQQPLALRLEEVLQWLGCPLPPEPPPPPLPPDEVRAKLQQAAWMFPHGNGREGQAQEG